MLLTHKLCSISLNERLDKNLFFLFSMISLNAWLNTSLKGDSSIKFVLHHLKQMTNDWRGIICFWWRYGGLCKFSSAIVTQNKAPLNEFVIFIGLQVDIVIVLSLQHKAKTALSSQNTGKIKLFLYCFIVVFKNLVTLYVFQWIIFRLRQVLMDRHRRFREYFVAFVLGFLIEVNDLII